MLQLLVALRKKERPTDKQRTSEARIVLKLVSFAGYCAITFLTASQFYCCHFKSASKCFGNLLWSSYSVHVGLWPKFIASRMHSSLENSPENSPQNPINVSEVQGIG